MNTDKVTLDFDSSYIGTMTSPTGSIKMGDQTGGMQPYHLLFGALGSCFYATFLGIAKKKRLTFSKATLDIGGHKRDEIPPTLDNVKIHLIIFDASDEAQFIKSAQLGAEYCSIHETISKVAKINLDVTFASTK